MPPPHSLALLFVTVLFVTVSVPSFQMPPPSLALLCDTVVFVTMSVPLFAMPPPSPLVLPFSIVKLFKKAVPALMVNTDPLYPVPLRVPEPSRVRFSPMVKFPVQVPCTISVEPGGALLMAVCRLPPALQFTIVV